MVCVAMFVALLINIIDDYKLDARVVIHSGELVGAIMGSTARRSFDVFGKCMYSGVAISNRSCRR